MSPPRPDAGVIAADPRTKPARSARRGAKRASARRFSLGLAPLLVVLAAVGVYVIAAANNASRLGETGAEAAFWLGLLAIYAPITLRLFGRSARYEERMALVVVLGLALYLVKVVHSPAGFTLHDELASWRGVADFLSSGRLFGENPIVQGYSVFPGMTAITGATSDLSGLSIFHSALILIGLARVVLTVALFVLLTRAIDSSRVAGIAIAVYACNPSMLYFDSQFGYESLALAMAGGYLLVVLQSSGLDPRRARPSEAAMLGALLLTTCGLVVTHHLSTYAMVAFLAVWALVLRVTGGVLLRDQLLAPAVAAAQRGAGAVADVARRLHAGPALAYARRLRTGPALACIILTVVAALWFTTVAGGATQDELGSVFSEAISAVFHLIFGGGGTKTLFKAGTGQVDPLIVRVLGLASVGVLALVIPLGAWRIWKSYRPRPLAISLAAVALLYPLTLVPRLTQAGSEISQRASEFVFAGIGFVAAVFFVHMTIGFSSSRARLYQLVATALATLVFVGGVILGESPVSRQPGPFEVGAEARSISPQGESAAAFAAAHLPEDSRILVDGPNGLLLGSYGRLDPVIGGIGGIPVTRVFFDASFEPVARQVIERDEIDYVVVDRRLSHSLPVDGYYYDREEPRAYERVNPISAEALRKFNDAPGVERIFDNGPIVIYDTTAIRPRQP